MNNHKKRHADEQLDRVFGRLGFSAIALNGTIGAGIFALPAVAASRAGYFSPWMFLLCAVLIMVIVLAFARAASLVRGTGGPIVYAGIAFGPFIGFQTGWLLWVSRLAAMAANTVLLVSYAAWLLPTLDSGLPRAAAIGVVVLVLSCCNIVGARAGMGVIYLLSVLKLLPLLLLLIVGLPQANAELLFGATVPEVHSLGETILILLYAFVGFEGAVVPAGEAREPRRDIPVALLTTAVLISLLYFLIQWVAISVLPDLARSERPLAAVAGQLMGESGALLLVAGAVLSIAGNLSASVLGAPRLTYALGLDGRLPRWFGSVHPRYHSPANSVAFYGIAGMMLAVTGSFVWLAVMSTLVRLLAYALCVLSLPRLAKHAATEPAKRQSGSARRLYPLQLVALLLCTWLATEASSMAWLTTAGFMLLGTVFYHLAAVQRSGLRNGD